MPLYAMVAQNVSPIAQTMTHTIGPQLWSLVIGTGIMIYEQQDLSYLASAKLWLLRANICKCLSGENDLWGGRC